MKLKTVIDEDFINYRLSSMFIAMNSCSFKCCHEAGLPVSVCQNSETAQMPTIEVSINELIKRYMCNPITSAIVLGGLEPMDQAEEILSFIYILRTKYKCMDDVVIYTGYTEDELKYIIPILTALRNVIVKFGRYIPNQEPHYDKVLGVNLASNNQYGKRLNKKDDRIEND